MKQTIATYITGDGNNFKFKIKDKEYTFVCVKKDIKAVLVEVKLEDRGTDKALFEIIINKKDDTIYLNEAIKYDPKKQKSLIDVKPVVEEIKEEKIKTGEVNNFNKLSKIKCNVEKKGKFNYVSWAECWKQVKKHDANANFKVIETDKGFPAWLKKDYGGFVKVQVTIDNQTYLEIYPITNNFNRPIPNPDCMDINTAIKRALVKSCSYSGIGLYVFEGEDLPEDEE